MIWLKIRHIGDPSTHSDFRLCSLGMTGDDNMAKRTRQGWKLLQQSLSVMMENKKLFIFPIISTFLCLIALIAILAPFSQLEHLHLPLTQAEFHQIYWLYVILLTYFFITHLIIFFFNAALTIGTNTYFKGNLPKLNDALKIAIQQFWRILLWTLFATTIGIFIMFFSNALRKFKFTKDYFGELSWPIVNYLTAAILIIEKKGPIKTLKRSTHLIQSTWGEPVIATFGFAWILLISRLVGLIPLVIGLLVGGSINIIMGSTITVIVYLVISMINSSTRTVLCSAIYLYAAEGLIPSHFDETLIQQAFRKFIKSDQ